MAMINIPLRYLWVYSAADEWTVAWHERLLHDRRKRLFDIESFCITPPELQRRWLPFPELDRRWKEKDRALMAMYEALAAKLQDRDVLILYNGANLHPDFVGWFNILKVYTAGDDPESTKILTKPVAPAFDIHLVNNIHCVDMYRSWGLKNVYFWPLGSQASEVETADINADNILDLSRRPVPILFFGERQAHREDRLGKLANTFPQAFCAGRGWPRGFLDWSEMWQIYRTAQIGWNVHNSLGPVNFRTYELPAYGVMQICDNKSYLAQIYELGREAVGFNTVDECIDITRYFLAHPIEQRTIALAGWERWKQDYTPDRVWDRLVSIVERHWADFNVSEIPIPDVTVKLEKYRKQPSIYPVVGKLRPGYLLRPFKPKIKKALNGLRNLLKHG